MAGQKLKGMFGEEIEDTFDSLLSVPGAFGNIFVGIAKQIRLFDAAFLALIFAGWMWLLFGVVISDNDDTVLLLLAVLPTIAWVICGIVGGLIFEVGGVGWRSLALWESYLLMVVFITFGVISLRIAVNPKDRHIYRGTPIATDAPK